MFSLTESICKSPGPIQNLKEGKKLTAEKIWGQKVNRGKKYAIKKLTENPRLIRAFRGYENKSQITAEKLRKRGFFRGQKSL